MLDPNFRSVRKMPNPSPIGLVGGHCVGRNQPTQRRLESILRAERENLLLIRSSP